MLRVYSILYLEQVWTRPLELAKTRIVEQDDNASPEQLITAAMAATNQDDAVGSYGSTPETDNLVSTPSSSLPQQEEPVLAAAAVNEEQQQNDDEAEEGAEIASTSTPSGTMGELSSSNSSIHTTSDGGDQVNGLLVNTLNLPRTETPLTQHNEQVDQFVSSSVNFTTTTSKPKKLPNGREFYDDDIDIDDEDDNEFIVQQQSSPITMMNRQKELPSTPSSPNSSRFSPKRIIHRAKSSIHDDSVVKNIGRRTSLFLEKLNQHHQSSSPPPPLPVSPISMDTKNSSHHNSGSSNNNINMIKGDLTKGLRRQSFKLTVKGKTLTKNIRRVLSFHQSQQQAQHVI